jgi:hypothetical protein
MNMKKFAVLFTLLCFFFIAQSQSWLIDGNTGTNPKINFIGNKDDNPLLFRINNKFSGQIDSVNKRTFFGFGAGRFSSNIDNTAFGFKALGGNASGTGSTAIGSSALAALTTAWECVGVGYAALTNNTTGWYNTATGAIALFYNTTGCCNAADGMGALSNNTTTSYNTANGYESLYFNTGTFNTATGALSLFWNKGDDNTADGYRSLYNNNAGIGNTASGSQSLYRNRDGNNNTAIGGYALYNNYNSWLNTAIGFRAAFGHDMGWNNTMVGAYCDINADGYYNCVALGEGVICTASSQARIGNSSTTSIGGYTNWSNISDGRIKKNIQDNVPGLLFINKLKPVTYNLDLAAADKIIQPFASTDKDGKIVRQLSPNDNDARKQKEQVVYSGFVAQEVETAAKELGYDFSGVDAAKNSKDLYGLRYAEFVVPLVKAVQELSKENEELKKQNADLIKRIEKLESFFVTKN